MNLGLISSFALYIMVSLNDGQECHALSKYTVSHVSSCAVIPSSFSKHSQDEVASIGGRALADLKSKVCKSALRNGQSSNMVEMLLVQDCRQGSKTSTSTKSLPGCIDGAPQVEREPLGRALLFLVFAFGMRVRVGLLTPKQNNKVDFSPHHFPAHITPARCLVQLHHYFSTSLGHDGCCRQFASPS
jgi:hypothetical protein